MSTPFIRGTHYRVTDAGCHEWVRAKSHDGYAHAFVGGQHVYGHRVVWEEAHGPLSKGMTVDHLCFNAACVKLDHLRELDFLTNSRLQRSASKTHCVNGHEYSAENTYRRPSNHRRQCRTCKVEATRRWRERQVA